MDKQQLIELKEEIKYSSIPRPSQEVLLELLETGVMPDKAKELDEIFLDRCKEVNRLNKQLEEMKSILPICAVGDIVYFVSPTKRKIYEMPVTKVTTVRKRDSTEHFYDSEVFGFCNLDIGRTTYLFREAAEQKLEKLKKCKRNRKN